MNESQTSRDEIVARLDAQEQELECLRNTLGGLARAAGDVAVSGRCKHCDQCYLLVANGDVYCPYCEAHRTL